MKSSSQNITYIPHIFHMTLKSLTTTLNHHIAALQNVNHTIISFHSYPTVNSQQLVLIRTRNSSKAKQFRSETHFRSKLV